MVRGLFTAYTGMLNEQKRLDVVSNNLANAATVGFKGEGVTNQSFKDVLAIKVRDGSEAYANKEIGTMNLGVKLGETYTDFEQGSLRHTGNTFDMAIGNKGFFALSMIDKDGNETVRYTRAGSFKQTQDGTIVDEDGNKLQGDAGAIQIPFGANDVAVDTGGAVYADGQYLDTIKLVDFENYDYLKKFGDNMYETVEGAVEKKSTGTIQQGYTEQSNISVVSEMIEMISISRAYEANQKVIKTVDSMIDKSVNSVGKL